MKIGLVLGTRPEIIKMAPLIRACQQSNTPYFVIHSNQHYSKEMDELIFADLELPQPDYNLEVGSGIHGEQTGRMLERIEQVYLKEKPTHVIVQGDTNTTLAGALAARKMNIPVGHIEAGLRSFDNRMPEETNRTLVDHMTDFCFTPTAASEQNLLNEGISPQKIHIVGNTVVDAVYQHIELAEQKSQILQKLNLTSKNYFLVTAHRAETIDNPEHLKGFIQLFQDLANQYNLPVIFPIHPRTQKQIDTHNITIPEEITTLSPTGYLDTLILIKNAKLVLTDSGGLQEESCILKTKCITLRENTERPETVTVGGNIIAGIQPEKIKASVTKLLDKEVSWSNPFGDGTTGKKCIEIITGKTAPKTENANTTVCVVGLGYMGLPTASLLATNGYQVIGVDINPEKVASVNRGECPFDEPGLPELVTSAHKSGKLQAQTEMPKADIFIISVPTPEKDRKINLDYVKAATETIATTIEDGNLVILESTVAPNTCKKHLKPILDQAGKNYHLAHCPERAIPGNTLYELVHNDRIIGGLTPKAAEISQTIYSNFVKGKIFLTNITTAETCKLMENTFRDTNIALANEFAKIAEDLEINVWEAIQLANKHPRVNILTPGPGVGGHCLAVDPWFLTESTQHAKIIPAAREVNDSMPETVVNLIEKHATTSDTIAILGVAYKPNVDDARETPATDVIRILKQKGYKLLITDPFVKDYHHELTDIETTLNQSTIAAIVTDHTAYKKIDFDKHPNLQTIVDTRNCLTENDSSSPKIVTLGNYLPTTDQNRSHQPLQPAAQETPKSVESQ